MALASIENPSGKQIQKAGSKLRRHFRGDSRLSEEEFTKTVGLISVWRSSFARPLVTANNCVRGYLRGLGISAPVTQRLKRMSTILEKLEDREKTLSLERMRDIGGCRAVVDSLEEVYALASKIERTRPSTQRIDYIASPRPSGYRAVHVIAEYAGRPIEVQIRTVSQHKWALMVEERSSLDKTNYKQDGSLPFQQTMLRVSRLMAEYETGQSTDEFVAELLRALELL